MVRSPAPARRHRTRPTLPHPVRGGIGQPCLGPFPSPDSDYNVRFVYARPADWYLSVYPGRDVIETPIEDEMDVNGWDLRKALHLVLKSNAVISEWMESPIVYRRDAAALRHLRAVADRMLNPRALAYH